MTKRKLLYVSPVSEIAESRFRTHMNSLNTCKIDSEDSQHYYLSSISGHYQFQMMKSKDSHWKILKSR